MEAPIDDAVDVVPTQTIASNPLLARLNKLPGITVRLPSTGIFYTNGELDAECTNGEVTVFPMTTTDELLMRSADMLFQGTAIDHVFKRCVPQIKKPLELLVGDIDYILTQLRKVSYGSQLPITYVCDCAKTPEEIAQRRTEGTDEYLIPIEDLILSSKELNIKNFNSQFKVKLHNGQVVILQPLRFVDFLRIQQLQDPEKLSDVENVKEFISTNFTSITKSVDGIEDRDMIKEWYKELPRTESEAIKRKLDEMDGWGIEFTYTLKCKHCKEDKVLTTQLNPVYFFTLPSSPETRQS